MKLTLEFNNAQDPQVRFLAETEFERHVLRKLVTKSNGLVSDLKPFLCKFEAHYPNHEPKDLNNPCFALVMYVKSEKVVK